MALVDQSVRQAVAAATAAAAGGALAYENVRDIIRGAFDYGMITVQEREDLREVLGTMPMEARATRALRNFLDRVDALSKAADERARATGDKQHGTTLKLADTGPFHEYDTDLGKFSHGNFDARYDPVAGEVIIGLRVKYHFEKGVTPTEQQVMRLHKMPQAVQAWDNAQATLESAMLVLNPVIRIRFKLFEVTKDANKRVDVDNSPRREWVASDINIHKGTSIQTLIHELGHVYGNYDEYRGSGFLAWVERRMYWHDNRYLSDTNALMNSGTDFRPRYFDHIQNWVNRHFARVGAWYGVRF